jgi:S1-C subfamily serine protease
LLIAKHLNIKDSENMKYQNYKLSRLILSLLFSMLLITGASLSAEPVNGNTYDKSVVMVRCVQQQFDYSTPWKQKAMGSGVGSGFLVGNGLILTNAHNIGNAKYVEVRKQDLAKRYPATVAFVGHDCDLAILQVKDMTFYDGMINLEIGDIPATNSTVQTYGFPMGWRPGTIGERLPSRQ